MSSLIVGGLVRHIVVISILVIVFTLNVLIIVSLSAIVVVINKPSDRKCNCD